MGAVPQNHVRHFMAHNGSQLRLVVHGFHEAGENKHGPARQREGIDFPYIQEGERELKRALFGLRRRRQPVANPAEIILQERVVHNLVLLPHLFGIGLSEFQVLLLREQVKSGLQRLPRLMGGIDRLRGEGREGHA